MTQSLQRSNVLAAAFGAAVLLCGLALPAFAAGGADSGSSGGTGSSDGAPTTPKCKKGKVWDPRKHKCVEAHAEAVPDEAFTDYAYTLAHAGRYQEALAMLDLLRRPDTPKALNYRGYATRKLGRTDEGIKYYLKSVAMDPHYAKVREYLGEAYVIKGRLDLAKEQLAAIGGICGKDCEEYRDLNEAIGGHNEG